MTHKESICVLCANLEANENAVCITNGNRSLVSECLYGGKNAGNRKKCKNFRQAEPQIVTARKDLLNGRKYNGC